jgi:hypothetical protein
MRSPRRDRHGWRHAIAVIALLSAIALVLVVMARFDGVFDRVAVAQAVGEPGVDGPAGRHNNDVDTRLVLQLGMLLALLYVAFVCVWLSRTRGGAAMGDVIDRLRSRSSVALANLRARVLGRPVRATGDAPSVCSIAWKPGHHRSRFQAVISNPGAGRPRVVAESDGLPWPPKDARNPPTRELEAALASLVAKIVAAGWEPVQSKGSWTERRFVWRPTNLVALAPGEVATKPAAPRGAARQLPLVAAAVLVIASALGGLLLANALDSGSDAPTGRPSPAPQALIHGGLRVQLPDGWAAAQAAPLPGFARPLGMSDSRKQLSAVIERLPATSPTLLPAALVRAEAATGARPELVRLAPGQTGWRYRFPHADGSVRTVIAAPTTAGVATVACTSRARSGGAPACQTLASAITVPGSRPLPPDASAAFLSRLPAVVSDLEGARATGVKQLSSAMRADTQARAAAGLARAHTAAATALAPLASPGDAVPTGTVVALSATATAYAKLASAARSGAAPRYADAGRAVRTAEVNLHRAVAEAAARANAASSAPVSRPAPPAKKPSLLIPLLGLIAAAAILGGVLLATGVLRRVH